MTFRIFTLENIINYTKSKEAIILLDNSSINKASYFFPQFYKCTRYHQIDFKEIKNISNTLDSVQKFLSIPNTRIIQKVIDEFESFEKVIREKASTISKIENYMHTFNKNQKYVKISKDANSYEKNLLDNFCLNISKTKKCLNARIFRPTNENIYQETYELFNHIKNNIIFEKEKLCDDGYYNPIQKASKPERDTDERIVAAGIYTSLCERKPCNIITMDKDIGDLIKLYFRILENKEFAEYHKKLYNSLRGSRISVYFVAGKDYNLTNFWEKINNSGKETFLFAKERSAILPKEETQKLVNKISSNLENLLSNYKESIILAQKTDEKENKENLEYAHSLQSQSPLTGLVDYAINPRQ